MGTTDILFCFLPSSARHAFAHTIHYTTLYTTAITITTAVLCCFNYRSVISDNLNLSASFSLNLLLLSSLNKSPLSSPLLSSTVSLPAPFSFHCYLTNKWFRLVRRAFIKSSRLPPLSPMCNVPHTALKTCYAMLWCNRVHTVQSGTKRQ